MEQHAATPDTRRPRPAATAMRPRPARARAAVDGRFDRVAAGLGWFSLGLGLAEVLVPHALSQLIGMPDDDRRRGWMRAFGVRELAAGVGILAVQNPTPGLWARVAGDGLDLAALARALAIPGAQRGRLAGAIAAVAGVTALDVAAGIQTTRAARQPIVAHRSVSVNREPSEVYRFWHDFENLPRFMRHLESVRVLGGGRSQWRAKAPAGTSVTWDAEVVRDEPNAEIVWRSLPGASVPNRGSVRFQSGPGGRGTVVDVELEYALPAGKVGAVVARLFGREPGQEVADDLRRLKQILETGEIATAKSPAARTRPSVYGE